MKSSLDLLFFTSQLLISLISAYIYNRRLLSLADAGGRLMYAYKDLVEVAGLTGKYVAPVVSRYS